MNILQIFAACTPSTQSGKISSCEIGINGPVTDANSALAGILNFTYIWAGIICVAIIIVAGFLYVVSDGNATKIKRAKDAITGSIVGIVVIMMAFVITKFVTGRF
ncbi:MAG: hypothetical protein ACHQTE_02600 [Candidatus Saccharimonadales bacterium]